MIKKIAVVSAFTLLVTGGGAVAQSVWLAPTFGSITLVTGFNNDPRAQTVTAGGPISASPLPSQTPNSCTGFIANAPDYRVNYTAGQNLPLIISVISNTDTTLVINDPSKRWFCADDTNGINPAVTFQQPRSGQYDIWVGTFNQGPTAPATVFVSELRAGTAADIAPPPPPPPAAGLDFSLAPNSGSLTLDAGFSNDPRLIAIIAGGTVNANTASNGCAGFVTSAPEFRLVYTAGTFPLIISALANVDTTLVVNLPNGTWACDDDSGGNLNPRLVFNNPMSGTYDIWVGTFVSGAEPQATLRISELN